MQTSDVSETTYLRAFDLAYSQTAVSILTKASEVNLQQYLGKRRLLFSLLFTMCLASVLIPQAKADFIGYYDLTNFTLTNTDNEQFPSFTDGTATTPDGGQSVVLTGGNGGSGIGGTTDLFINAAAAGIVQFNWAFSSSDPSSAGTFPLGCGLGFTGSCDDAGYLLNGTFVQLSDDILQGSGLVSFAVTVGESFGFRVETLDNLGGAGVLTLSNFSAPADPSPVPEPGYPAILLGLTAVMASVQRWKTRVRANQGGNQ